MAIEPSEESLEERERRYWDAQSSRYSDDALLDGDPQLASGSERLHLHWLGELQGKRLLDVGCGVGQWSVFLAKLGAEVWAIDISPASLEVARRNATLHGVEDRIHFDTMNALATSFPDQFFDRVHGQDVIHHLDPELLGREVGRVLRPGGRAIFTENCANNPLLMLARKHLCGRFGIPRWSSGDEYPLTREGIRAFGASFLTVDVAFPDFRFFHLLNAKLFGYRSRLLNHAFDALDAGIYRFLPILRPWSYRQVIRFSFPRAAFNPRWHEHS